MRKIGVIAFLWMSLLSWGQERELFGSFADTVACVGIYEWDHLGASSVSAGFMQQVLLKRDLSRDVINEEELALGRQTNLVSLHSERGGYWLAASPLLKNTPLRWGLSMGQQYRAYADFSQDAFRLVFKGNLPYEGEQLEVGDVAFRMYAFDQLKFHLLYPLKRGETVHSFGLELGFLAGKKLQRIEAFNTSLYTAPYGEYLDVETNFSYAHSHTKVFYKGYGGMASLYYSYQKKKSSFELLLKDVGALRWGNRMKYIAKDTVGRFEGFDLASFLKQPGTSLNTDSIQQALVGKYRDTNAYVSPVLTEFFVKYTYRLNEKWSLEAGGGLRSVYYFQPWLFEKNTLHLSSNSSLSVMFTYDGFNPLFSRWPGVGLEMKRRWGSWQFSLAAPFVSAVFSSRSNAGAALYMNINKSF